MRRFFTLFVLFCIGTCTAALWAQQKVSGVVVDKTDNFPVIGANVLVKGTTNGVITDLDGKYSLEVSSPEDVLVFSYLGMKTVEEKVGTRTVINVDLYADTHAIDEVVVTALGIKREKKALGYAMQEVKGDKLTETRDVNVANSLAGKVAGVQIKQNGTGVGGSTRIVIRGNNSIGGNNQPLVVVDGVPIDNFSNTTDDYWGNSNVDRGSGISDISPDDIESMSVLKGPAASALYGSRAGNGVVMITTKKGAGKGKSLGITLNSNFTFDNPMLTPEMQNEYGQGASGAFDRNRLGSWGAKMDGSTKEMALGSFAYAARDNNLFKDFLRTGSTWTNSMDISKSSEDMTFRAAVTRLDNKAAVPNSGMDRTSINLRSTAKLADWLSADIKVNYINQNTNNRIQLAADPNNIFIDYLTMGRSIAYSDWDAYEATNWKRSDGRPAAYVIDHNSAPRNPYWSAYRNLNKDKRDRYIGFAALDFTFTDWLALKLRSGMDNYTSNYEMTRATGNPYWETNGSFRVQTERYKEINSDFLLTAQGNWDKFGIVGTVGGNIMYRSTSLNNDFSGELVIPDFYNINNGRLHTADYYRSRHQINSLYATASLSYNDYLYLDVTARNDWSSTLPKGNDSYFYPSVGGSWVFSQMLNKMNIDLGPISFGKVRLSYAEVGNDTDPYMLRDYYNISYDIKGSTFNVSNRDWLANPDLKNETIKSWEVGLELKAFENRLGVDVAYYKKNAENQILRITVPSSTGYRFKMVNAGNIQNSGWELALNAIPVQSAAGFSWESIVNFSKNVNKIVELTEDTKRQILSDGTGVSFMQIVAEEGGAYGDMYGYAYDRDAKGNVIIGSDGIPVRAGEMKKLGNNQPEWMLGWSNTLSYKNVSLSFLFDLNYGGNVYMGSIQNGARFGTLGITLPNREGGLIVPGVMQDGSVNNTAITAEQYWTGIRDIAEPFVYDATNARLRELSLAYTFPRSLLAKTPIAGLKASFIARNLFMIYGKTENFDPEAGFSNANSVQGIEYGSMPTMRSIGFNLNVTF